MGVVIITIAVVKGQTANIDPNSPTNLKACSNLSQYSKGFYLAWSYKQK